VWIFTNTGFVSAVSDGKDLVVRSRDLLSLEPLSLFAGIEIFKTPESDYPYRLKISHQYFSNWLSLMAREIDYRNFKSEVSVIRGKDFAHPLMSVWSVMHEIEDQDARKRMHST
jgi:hypothetical protein